MFSFGELRILSSVKYVDFMKYKIFEFLSNKYIVKALIIFWICVIFSFSLQPSIQSESLTDGVGELILEYASSDLQEDSNAWSYIEWRSFHKFIRKCGHFIEFFILGILMVLNMDQMQVMHKKRVGLLLCTVVASIDESIQLFVPGRSGQISDVVLDCFGSFIGIYICAFILKRK